MGNFLGGAEGPSRAHRLPAGNAKNKVKTLTEFKSLKDFKSLKALSVCSQPCASITATEKGWTDGGCRTDPVSTRKAHFIVIITILFT